MRLSLCTISFRHCLISIDQLASWACLNGFQGIELWGIHAKNLATQPHYDAAWLRSFGLYASMLSDYLPLDRSENELIQRMDSLCCLAQHWGTTKIRTFAGQRSSNAVAANERAHLVGKLRLACSLAHKSGTSLLVETHPGTLADSTASTLQLLREVDHPALGINFDVLHVWESGDDPLVALDVLKPSVRHYHLKNVTARALLHVFAPANVYAAAGSRDGMVSLFDGVFDYQSFLAHVSTSEEMEASLEWFGDDIKQTLHDDSVRLQPLTCKRSIKHALPETVSPHGRGGGAFDWLNHPR